MSDTNDRTRSRPEQQSQAISEDVIRACQAMVARGNRFIQQDPADPPDSEGPENGVKKPKMKNGNNRQIHPESKARRKMAKASRKKNRARLKQK